MARLKTVAFIMAGLLGAAVAASAAHPAMAAPQSPPSLPASRIPAMPAPTPLPTSAPLPADYVIGADDVLNVIFRRDREMSAEVIVRPDGKVTLQLLDDIQAAGLTPEEFRDKVTEAATRFFEGDPNVTVIVRQINSRKVFITGQVRSPGAYPIGSRLTVVQLIALAGGLTEFANEKDIVIVREAPAGATRAGATPAVRPVTPPTEPPVMLPAAPPLSRPAPKPATSTPPAGTKPATSTPPAGTPATSTPRAATKPATPAPRAATGPTTFRFNYRDIWNPKKLASNIDLKPGDTVIVR